MTTNTCILHNTKYCTTETSEIVNTETDMNRESPKQT